MRGRGPSVTMIAALNRLFETGIIAELKEKGSTHRTRQAFSEFVRKTNEDWSRMAREIHRRWEVPAAVQTEDILAELLTAVWRLLPKWDPGLRPLADYVCWNAYAEARKWINRQRDAYRRDGKNQSRHPIAESMLPRSGGETDRRRSVSEGSDGIWSEEGLPPEERIHGARLGREIVERLDPDEAEAFILLVEETRRRGIRSPEGRAARRLSGETRLRNRIGTERQARLFVGVAQRRAAEIAEEIGTTAA